MGFTRQHRYRSKVNPMLYQPVHVGMYSFSAGPTFFVDPLIAVNVERDSDIFEEAAFEKFDVAISQNGEIGLDRIPTRQSGSENVLLNEIHLLVKLNRDQKRLATMPQEVYFFDHQLIDIFFDVLERVSYLLQTHAGPVAKVRKFVAVIAAQIAVFGELENKLRGDIDGHRRARTLSAIEDLQQRR
jgi:hypothetical protein